MLEIDGPFDPGNAIIHGSTAFDPVSRIRTSVSVSYYGGSGGPVSYKILASFDAGLTRDNIFTEDPETGRRTYRSIFGGPQKLCDFSLPFKETGSTLELTVKSYLPPERVSFETLFDAELSQPAAVLTYILQIAQQMFPDVEGASWYDRVIMHVQPEIARLIDWPEKKD